VSAVPTVGSVRGSTPRTPGGGNSSSSSSSGGSSSGGSSSGGYTDLVRQIRSRYSASGAGTGSVGAAAAKASEPTKATAPAKATDVPKPGAAANPPQQQKQQQRQAAPEGSASDPEDDSDVGADSDEEANATAKAPYRPAAAPVAMGTLARPPSLRQSTLPAVAAAAAAAAAAASDAAGARPGSAVRVVVAGGLRSDRMTLHIEEAGAARKTVEVDCRPAAASSADALGGDSEFDRAGRAPAAVEYRYGRSLS
jgi:hypothetical protein